MADSDSSSVIDGFSVLKAIRLGDEKTPSPRPTVGARTLRTTLPSRHEIVCYRCDHIFYLHGRLRATQCPRCRTSLQKVDYEIEGPWNRNVETIGAIHIAGSGVLKEDCRLAAGEIVLKGAIENGKIRACRRLTLAPGARFELACIEARDFVVANGAVVSFPDGQVKCRNAEVEGELETRLHAKGTVLVRAGGILKGEVRAEHLVVEEGGGLVADVFIALFFRPQFREAR